MSRTRLLHILSILETETNVSCGLTLQEFVAFYLNDIQRRLALNSGFVKTSLFYRLLAKRNSWRLN